MTEKNGELPKGWKWVKLGDVCTIVMGQSPEGTSYNFNGMGEPLLNGPTEFGKVHPIPTQWTTDPTRFAEAGDILFCVRGATTGRKNIADRQYCIGRGLAAVRGNSNHTITEFLFYLLDFLTNAILEETAGSTFPNLSRERFENFKVLLPPLPEQKRIVAILNEQMAAVEKARAAAEAQLQAAKTLPAAYLREVFDSPDAQKWERKTLGDIAITCSGSTPLRTNKEYYIGTIPWVKTGELKDCDITHTEERISETALKETSLRLLPVGTLLIAMYGQGQTRGRTGLLTMPATTNQACFAILPNPELFDSSYIQWWFRHSYSRLRKETEGRGGNQPNLNGEVLRLQEVPLPRIDIQKNIVKTLNQSIETVEGIERSLQDQLNTIKQLPAALLRQAFNGEL